MSVNEIKKIICKMTLEEKVSFCVGKDFWHLQGLDRLGIPVTMVTDGPHGLRKQVLSVDHLGLSESKTAICFPAGCALASSYDPKLAEELGIELGKLAQAEEVSVVLGPAMNIKRSPLCGRNFEYYSEDPLVSSKIAAGTIKGVQSQNIGTSPKHFVANNQEHYRMTSNSVVDERTMREIYLSSFEWAVKEAKPWTIMCSYNRINGTYASENKTYLTDILRDEWGFDGYVMTDWGACDDPVDSIQAGLDLEMPGPSAGNIDRIIQAIKDGRLKEAIVDQRVEHILNVVFRYSENHKIEQTYDFEAGHETARKIAANSAVLLKNEDSILPLMENENILIIGKYAKQPRFQGGGSSHINPYRVSSAWDILGEKSNVKYVEGYVENEISDKNSYSRTGAVTDADVNIMLIAEAVEAAKEAKKVLIFVGLPDSYETEGVDRKNLMMPENQNQLIEAVSKVQSNTIVVLHNGSPISMPWINSVKAVLEIHLGGEAVGLATADILYGRENPSGRLAETFPIRIEDTSTYPYYGVEKDDVIFREGVLVGYRYYETMKKPVLFPFGYGLSYTTFAYSNLKTDKDEILDTDKLNVSITVTNTGKVDGKEVVQLYVAGKTAGVVRPIRELRAFDKVTLKAGESKVITFSLDKRAFAYWNVDIHDWYVSTGDYKIQIGTSAADIILEKSVQVTGTSRVKPHFTINSPIGDIMAYPAGMSILRDIIGQMIPGDDMTEEQEDAEKTGLVSKEVIMTIFEAMSLRSMLTFSPAAKLEQYEELIAAVNQAIINEK